MRCELEYVNAVRSKIGFDVPPIEEEGTMDEENCFAYAGIYLLGDIYVVYMKDEERVCIEEASTIDEAREVAKRFVKSIC
ncbi:hypothetical protein [Thermocladium modestius]|uniref:hypothetical protein n=1 Tax=Thermocladium modestius TaxID=62609 RepID=UPI001E51248C|nr:hypothetical protein [Thermocladium modestius]